MPKRYLHNDGPNTMFVGSVMIPPGQGREVDEAFLPPADPAPATAIDGADGTSAPPPPLAILQALPVRDLLPQLETLSDAGLAALAELEQGTDMPRVTVLGAISKLQLDRAQKAAGGEPA